MEQYWMPKRLDFKHLRLCLTAYTPNFLFIRSIGSMGGAIKVVQDLDGRTLDFKKDVSGLYLFIDGNQVFHFPLKDYQKGFSLAYERIESMEDGIQRVIALSQGIDPYDPHLPEPTRSFLRIVLDGYLVELFFKGRVHLKFHSWWVKPHWGYWMVDVPEAKP